MNLGSFFTMQHAVKAFISSHPVSICLSLFYTSSFPMFWHFPFIPPALASWFPAPSAGPDDELPLHAAQAALTRRGVCADAGHLSLLTRYFRRTSAHTWTHTASCFTSHACMCVFSSTDRPGVTHHSVIDRNQETLALTLKTYIEAKRSEPSKQ